MEYGCATVVIMLTCLLLDWCLKQLPRSLRGPVEVLTGVVALGYAAVLLVGLGATVLLLPALALWLVFPSLTLPGAALLAAVGWLVVCTVWRYKRRRTSRPA